MKEIVALSLICFLLGFVGAYAFDAFLQWRDNRKWK